MAETVNLPRDSTLRVSRHPQARLHLGSPVLSLREEGGAVAHRRNLRWGFHRSYPPVRGRRH